MCKIKYVNGVLWSPEPKNFLFGFVLQIFLSSNVTGIINNSKTLSASSLWGR